MKSNAIALIAVLLILVAFPAGLFGYQSLRTDASSIRVIEITARAPQSGGFSPDHLELKAGETVRLRITSPDVMHGLSIPELGVEVKEILPGKPVEVDVTPQVPGRYAFACIRWCGIDHWRMRGTIDVVAADGSRVIGPAEAGQPLYQKLGINLDGPHPIARITPVGQGDGRPSAARGASLGVDLPSDLASVDFRRAISPAAAFEQMQAQSREDPTKASLDDAEAWDLVAWAWLEDVRPEALAKAESLYSRDCAACHGPEGRGDGPAGRDLPGLRGRPENGASSPSMGAMPGAAGTAMFNPGEPAGPADFTDVARTLAMSDAALQGKILRGGMGTGMPEFGSLYTDEELWALVAYIRTFGFQK